MTTRSRSVLSLILAAPLASVWIALPAQGMGSKPGTRPKTKATQTEVALLTSPVAPPRSPRLPPEVTQVASNPKLLALCTKEIERLGSRNGKKSASKMCQKAKVLRGCSSHDGRPIFHFDRASRLTKHQKILVFALTHGDEGPSGDVARSWTERLLRIRPRNQWRVIPVINPDGFRLKTRTNARRVDINRNFATKDWDRLALRRWKGKRKSDPRRYPGPQANSESETRCSIQHIEEFQPDFIISIHTPYGVLDFDGPKVPFPRFGPLPWHQLGNFPGSLGRYMWKDRGVPVLTVELKHSNVISQMERFDRLQDVTGTLAKRANAALEPEKKKDRATN